jgi:threonine synthase
VSPVAGGTLLPRIFRGFRELASRVWSRVICRRSTRHRPRAARRSCVRCSRARVPRTGQAVDDREVDRDRKPGGRLPGRADRQGDGGTGVASTDEQILQAMELLAETEGIFTEPAGGATLAGAIQLVQSGVIRSDESVVVCITGNGYKTAAETIASRVRSPVQISRSLEDFEAYLAVVGRSGGGAAASALIPCLRDCSDSFSTEDMTWPIGF